jgi:P4 family phage/plasmid primase-like protien
MNQPKDLNEFLAIYNSKKQEKKGPITHTRIGDKDFNVYGGSYSIPEDMIDTFYKLYYESIIINRNIEYLTETQLKNAENMVIDYDFRYTYDTTKRQHTDDDITEIINKYTDILKSIYTFDNNTSFNVYAFEKPEVNRLQDGSLTKDGIHFVFGIKIPHSIQLIIRDKMLKEIPNILNLPLINSWDNVLDEGISKGPTNWQIFGSRKPGNQAYQLVKSFNMTFDEADREFMMEELNITEMTLELFKSFSVQYKGNPSYPLNKKYEEKLNTSNNKVKKSTKKDKKTETKFPEIKKDGVLGEIEYLLNNGFLNEIKQQHNHLNLLKIKAGIYNLCGEEGLNLFLTIAEAHSTDYNKDNETKRYEDEYDGKNSNIPYQVITKIFKEYDIKLYRKLINEYELIIYGSKDNVLKYKMEYGLDTDYDLAGILFLMFGEKYKCVSVTNKIWYAFENHKWTLDPNISLRNKLSTDMFNKYQDIIDDIDEKMSKVDIEGDTYELLKQRQKGIYAICNKLKRTPDKNNIMREAMEIFIDNDFMKNLDENKFLLCCKNGVVDLKNKIFRDGRPDDYISLSTNINYIPYESENTELTDIINKIYPFESLKNYMINHLGSTLYGDNKNQTFEIYRGSGSNGKSIIADLMSHTLGEYKATVPLALVCGKRTQIGQSSSEIIQLKGVRYAVMNEPSCDTVINEGIMKEITGGDPLVGRALYCGSVTFTPQFSLVCATNYDMTITATDDGTWRRIRVADHLSKFIDEDKIQLRESGEVDENGKAIMVPMNDLEFIKDKNLKSRFSTLAIPFLSLLVKTAFENNGIVETCDMVELSTKEYRYSQNRFQQFISENIIEDDTQTLSKVVLNNCAKDWFTINYKFVPNMRTLYALLDTKYEFNGKKYLNIKLKCDAENPDEIYITKEEIFLTEFNKTFKITNETTDFIPSVSITEWAKLSNLKVSSSKEINSNLLINFKLDTKNKEHYKTKKINGKVVWCWFGIKRIEINEEIEEIKQ